MTQSKIRTIKVDYLARVEGEGAIDLKIKDNKLEEVRLKIFEPPRFFEAFLRGRNYCEAPDITSRICGICPIAYQMSAVHAIENAFGVRVEGPLRELRRLVYCGEWISSHALHIYMLHAPDFLGYESAIHLAKEHPGILERGLQLKKTGNDIMSLIGGREIHPINIKVGGFYKIPSKRELFTLKEKLEYARDAAIETVRWVAGFHFPDFEMEYTFVSLVHPEEYPFNEGCIGLGNDLEITIPEFDQYFEEHQVSYSNALHCTLKNKGNYFVGPMARYALNFDKLSLLAKEIAKEVTLDRPCKNPFKSIIVRSIEVLYACDEALRIIDHYSEPEHAAITLIPKAATGYGCTEAPRGLLYHRYTIDTQEEILDAKIVPPTSQNQATIEADLWKFIPTCLDLPEDQLQWQCEQTIRNYDPCISCATHFLKMNIERL